MRRGTGRTLLALLLGAALAACGSQPTDTGAPPPGDGPGTTVSAPTPGSGVAEAPDAISEPPEPPGELPERLRFRAKTIEGETFEGRDLFGAPAVLWFWAPWCPTCQAEAPTIAEAARIDGVRFLGVAALDEVPAMREFVDRYGLGTFAHLADTSGEVWRLFGVEYQPAYAFVTPAGEVEVETELLEPEELLARVRALA